MKTQQIVVAALLATSLAYCTAAPRPPAAVIVPIAVGAPSLSVVIAPPPPTPAANPSLGSTRFVERADAARRVTENLLKMYAYGKSSADEIGTWSLRAYDAQRGGATTGQGVVDAARERVDQMRKLEATAKTQVTAGVAPISDLAAATYFRLDAEIALAQVEPAP